MVVVTVLFSGGRKYDLPGFGLIRKPCCAGIAISVSFLHISVMVVVDSVTHVCGYLYIIVYSTTIQYTGTKQCCTSTHKGLSRDETLPQASFVQMLHPRMHSFFFKDTTYFTR